VIVRQYRGETPDRPSNFDDDTLWSLLKLCWNIDASQRPSISEVLDVLIGIENLAFHPFDCLTTAYIEKRPPEPSPIANGDDPMAE
jgi:hypothetical protein